VKVWTDEDGTFHEESQLSFFVEDQDLGTVPFDPGALPALGYRRLSLAYCCPACGEIWARVFRITASGTIAPFEFLTVACREHVDPWNVPGSLLAGSLGALLDVMPPLAVRREFEIYSTR
jgi:hypothetical protein